MINKPVVLPNLIRMKKIDAGVYEDLVKMQQHINLGAKDEPLSTANFSFNGMGAGSKVSLFAGTFKAGNFTLIIGTSPSANPVLSLSIPSGIFTSDPFLIVTRNGGNGAQGFTWKESMTLLAITILGTPAAGEQYTFQFSARN